MPDSRSHADRRVPFGTAAGTRPRGVRGHTAAAQTPLTVRARGIHLSDRVRQFIPERTGFKLSRFIGPVERVSVRFDRVRDIERSRPSVRCRIKIVLSRLQSVLGEGTAQSPDAAFGKALDASSRWFNSTLERRRKIIRRRSAQNGAASLRGV